MINSVTNKVASGGVWISALSCTACFPALGSLASALGLGTLSQFEGIAINTLLPIFASIALITNLYISYRHKNILRGVLSITGPVAVLLTLYPLWEYNWSTYLFYAGLILMMVISIADIVKPIKDTSCKI